MAEAPPAPPQSESGVGRILREIYEKALPVLLTAGGFLGFVTVAGGTIVWSRFYAAKLPADQAVIAMPRDELLVFGAVSLTLFAVLGAIAVVVAYLCDPQGRPVRSTKDGLLVVLLLEGWVIVFLAEQQRIELGEGGAALVAAVLVLAAVITAALLTRSPALTSDTAEDGHTRFTLTAGGNAALAAVVAAVVVGVGIIVGEWWASLALVTATALAMGCFAIADRTDHFGWYGIAVFFSIALLGTLIGIVQVFDDPLVQPAAAIRTVGDRHEGIQAIYVTESSDRVYLATIAARDCPAKGEYHAASESGRLFWIKKSETAALSIGPLQQVRSASEKTKPMLEELAVRFAPEAERQAQPAIRCE